MLRIEEHIAGQHDPIRENTTGVDDFIVAELVEATEAKLPKGGIGLVKGIGGKADIINRNGRFYSATVYALAVERAQKLISKGRFLGEVDHPYYGSLKGAAVRFTKLHMVDGLMKFEAVILDTPGGQMLKGLLAGGVGVAVSTRGYGSIKFEKMDVDGEQQEVGVIQDDYRMEGIDFVLFPSNVHGEVTHHENANTSTEQENIMDLEQLRKEHPELVEAIEAAAREGFVPQTDHDAALEEARASVLEGEEVTALRSLRDAVVEALRPHVPELAEAAEDSERTESQRELESLRSEFATLNERLEAVETERNQLASEAEERAARESVAAHVESVLADYAHADLIRDELLTCESAEAVDALFESRRGLVESLATRLGVKTDESGRGSGKAEKEELDEDEDEGDDTPEAVAEAAERARQRALAGLDS